MSTVADKWENKLADNSHGWKERKPSVVGLYDDWSDDYDESINHWGYEAPTRVAALLRGHLASPGGRKLKILDVGSGTGLVADALSKHKDFEDSLLYAMDFSQKSLDIAAKKQLYFGLTPHSFNETPFPYLDNSFDAITCVGCLTYCSDLGSAFREFVRITKPGAIMVISHRTDNMPKDIIHFDGMEVALKWEKVTHIEKQPYLPGNPNYGDKVLVDYYVARNSKQSSKL